MKVLLIEDQEKITKAIAYVLELQGYTVEIVHDGLLGYEQASTGLFDVIILDIMLPKMDGFTLLRKLKAAQIETPVLILSAKGEVGDRVYGLDLGADDYLAKPFAMEELISRLKVLTRRHVKNKDTLILDKNTLSLKFEDKSITLTLKEFQVFEMLYHHQGQTIQKEMFVDRIWGFDEDVDERIVEVYISFLRKKLKLFKAPIEIKTVRGVGYQLGEKNVSKS